MGVSDSAFLIWTFVQPCYLLPRFPFSFQRFGGDLLPFFDLPIKSVEKLQKGTGPEGAVAGARWGIDLGQGRAWGKEKGRWIGWILQRGHQQSRGPVARFSIPEISHVTVIVNLPPSPTLCHSSPSLTENPWGNRRKEDILFQ